MAEEDAELPPVTEDAPAPETEAAVEETETAEAPEPALDEPAELEATVEAEGEEVADKGEPAAEGDPDGEEGEAEGAAAVDEDVEPAAAGEAEGEAAEGGASGAGGDAEAAAEGGAGESEGGEAGHDEEAAGEAGDEGGASEAAAAGEKGEAGEADEAELAGAIEDEDPSVELRGAASRIAAARRGQLFRRGSPVSDPEGKELRPIPARDEEAGGGGEGDGEGVGDEVVEGEGDGGGEGEKMGEGESEGLGEADGGGEGDGVLEDDGAAEGDGEEGEFNEDEAYIEGGEDPDEVAAYALEDEEAARLTESWKGQQSRRSALAEANGALQRKLADYLRSIKKADDRAQAETSVTDQEARYVKCLGQVVELRDELRRLEGTYDAMATEMRQRLGDKAAKAVEIREAFLEFKREIFRASENSRTGKPIPAKLVASFEEQEAVKDAEVERMRLSNIQRRNALRKLELTLKQKENLAEGLHLIDFEQLKIENQTLNEKIEERNEELLKLRKKTTNTVQVRDGPLLRGRRC
jgi:hypothetical protein